MNARGIKELDDYSNGKRLTLKQMILAKCADCMNGYSDGKIDCQLNKCLLYPVMPYGALWMGREKKTMSQKGLFVMRQGLKRHRAGVIPDLWTQ